MYIHKPTVVTYYLYCIEYIKQYVYIPLHCLTVKPHSLDMLSIYSALMQQRSPEKASSFSVALKA